MGGSPSKPKTTQRPEPDYVTNQDKLRNFQWVPGMVTSRWAQISTNNQTRDDCVVIGANDPYGTSVDFTKSASGNNKGTLLFKSIRLSETLLERAVGK